jgi:DNA mismatch repair protein MutS
MVETAAILNQASQHSLVILDEIGRGTATYDGLSIAQAALESLHNVTRCRGLFATHYHELTRAMAEFARLENVSVSVREWGGDIVFLHKVVQGPADRSYGIQVARLAGLPRHVIARAQTLLSQYEAHGTKSLPTQSASAANQDVPQNSALQQALMALKPDDLSPREALEMLYNLKALSALEPAPKPAPTLEEPKDALE